MLQLCCIQFCTATKGRGAVCVSCFHATTSCRFQPRTPEIITSEASLSSFHFCIVCLKEKGTKLALTNLMGVAPVVGRISLFQSLGVILCWVDITFLLTWCAPVVGRISLFQSLGVILCWVDITYLPFPHRPFPSLLFFFFLFYTWLGPCLRTDGSQVRGRVYN